MVDLTFKITELLHQNSRTASYRCRAADGTRAIVRVARAPQAASAVHLVRHERDIMRKLGLTVTEIRGEAAGFETSTALISDDLPGESLASMLAAGLDIASALWIGDALARRLAHVHRNGVIVKDVSPVNILVSTAAASADFINYGVSSRAPRERGVLAHPGSLDGSLMYLSPEQTGRMNRSIDYRADFYSLGVLLYEMATGEPPFFSTDPLEVVHAHIAKQALSASLRNGRVPEILSKIIERLMAKNAEDRYQTASGLIQDLSRLRGMQASGQWSDFTLGQHDLSDDLMIPQKLYGREMEIARLLAAFDRVTQGQPEMVLVAGYSGVGKSTLVQETHKPIVDKRGYFIRGKYDQFKRNIPYVGIADAFGDLVHQILTESAESVANWQASLSAALGSHASIMVELIPDLELLLGEQPPPLALPAAESEGLFTATFTRFIHTFAGSGRPLVVFLDDLQWADAASLKLTRHLMTSDEQLSLLFVGAYRDNEVSPTHPLMLALESLEEGGTEMDRIELHPLSSESVSELVADALRTTTDECHELTSLLLDKTAGNPFFLLQFLSMIHADGLLARGADSWRWDLRAINELDSAENVVTLLVGRLRRLSQFTQETLCTAACIGSQFDLDTLNAVLKDGLGADQDTLWPAVEQGLILPPSTPSGRRYRFVHDRVQQASYLLADDAQRRQLHLDIGRRLWKRISDNKQQLEERSFDICGHLNRCADLLDKTERVALARLNLQAGKRAKLAAAYTTAVNLLAAGVEQLGSDSGFDSDYDTVFELNLEYAEALYLNGDLETPEHLFDLLLSNAHSDVEKAELYRRKSQLAYHNQKYAEAMASGLAGLALLDIDIPDYQRVDRLAALAASEGAALGAMLGEYNIAELIDLPELADPRKRVEAELLHDLALIGMWFTPLLVSVATLKLVKLSLTHGNSRASAPAYATYGMTIASAAGMYEAGYAFGEMALQLAQRRGEQVAECQTAFWFGAFTSHWRVHVSESISLLKGGVELGARIGAPVWAAYCALFVPVHSLMSGMQLDDSFQILKRYMVPMEASSRSAARAYQQLLRTLTGDIAGRGTFNDGHFDEETFVGEHDKPGLVLALMHYYTAKLMSLTLFGRSSDAIDISDAAARSGDFATILFAQYVNAPWNFYRAIAAADLLHCTREEPADNIQIADATLSGRRNKLKKILEHCSTELDRFATGAPDNFEHMALLVRAERASLADQQVEAMTLFDQAIADAHKNRFSHHEALANERTALFHLRHGRDVVGHAYLRTAHQRYAAWGATAKTQQLEEEYGDVLGAAQGQGQHLSSLAKRRVESGHDGGPDALDLLSVVKASRILSSEMDLERSLSRALEIVLESAGAERGTLLIQRHGELKVEAQGSVVGEIIRVRTYADRPAPRLEEASMLCLPIVQYAARTRDTVVLDDARGVGRFTRDPYIKQNNVRSVVCIPLVQQSHLVGAIYLENNLVSAAFTRRRIEMLKLICSHAVIAIENASLYSDLARSSHDLQRINGSMDRFVPKEFLACLGKSTLLDVALGQNVHREMSVLFSDIRGFTTVVESMAPADHIGFINEYLSYMEPAILQNDGFVDSYIGDAIMALFGDGADAAVQAGVDMSRGLSAFNQRRSRSGEQPIRMGVGLNTGSLTLGTIGGPSRIKCGVIGDSVNLAARIEELTKRYQTFMLMSDNTHSALTDPGKYATRVVGKVLVAGRKQPVTLYEVVDAEQDPVIKSKKLDTMETYARAVALFYAREFGDAGRYFAECVAHCPGDLSARHYQRECLENLGREVGPEWTGVISVPHTTAR